VVTLEKRAGGVRTCLDTAPPASGVALAWLGQAGFAVRCGDIRVLIDPYLSDYLSRKYQGKEYPHVRLMPSPLAPEDVADIDAVLCSHRHSDHMDPGLLPGLVTRLPACRYAVPAAEREGADALGLPAGRTWYVNAGDRIQLAPGSGRFAVPAAHEELKTDPEGRHFFVGYVLRCGDVTLYHSGDCTPYEGQADLLGPGRVDVALLPVNGRDAYRLSRGVIGNMDFDEAVALCRAARIPWMMPHHFGLFEFNTVDPDVLRRKVAALSGPPQCVVPDIDVYYVIDRDRPEPARS